SPERVAARALEDRVFGVVGHEAIRVPAVPALQPILHEAEVRHNSLPSRLRGVSGPSASTSDIQSHATGSFRRPCRLLRACPGGGSSAPVRAGRPCYPRRAWRTLAPRGRHGAAARAGQRRIPTRAGRGAAAEHAQPEPVPVPGSYDLPRTRVPVARLPAFPADWPLSYALCLLLGGGWRNPVGEPPLRTPRSPWWARHSLHRHADDLPARARNDLPPARRRVPRRCVAPRIPHPRLLRGGLVSCLAHPGGHVRLPRRDDRRRAGDTAGVLRRDRHRPDGDFDLRHRLDRLPLCGQWQARHPPREPRVERADPPGAPRALLLATGGRTA